MQNYQNNVIEASQFNELLDIDEVQPLSAEEMPFVEEFKQLLQKHNKLDRFGLTLLHRHFDLAEGEVLLEDTDVSRRIQEIRPIKADSLPAGSAMETAWRFDEDTKMWCVLYCINLGGHSCRHRDIFEIGTNDN
ncbi:MAG: hypothetical protein MUE85_14390 [Microscillaceae bacterium]|jgi:hypothetical protein|nr:hypothetical protein [Microscillaceae bacterium]